MIMEVCLVCSSDVQEGSRRILHNASAVHLIPPLRDILQGLYVQVEVDRVLPITASGVNCYVCRKCFRTVERYVKSRKEVEEAMVNVGHKLSMRRRDCSPGGSHLPPQQLTPTRKRKSDCLDEPLSKRKKFDTPTRDVISRTHAPNTPVVSVLEKQTQRVRVKRLTRSLKTLGRCIGRRDRAAVARQVMKDPKIVSKVIPLVGKILAKEMKATCSVDAKSILRNREAETLQSFTWSQLLDQVEKTAPTTLLLLRSSIARSRSSKASKSRSVNADAVVGLCCSILLRARSQRMNLIQRLISVLLYGGHATKQVYTRLQKLLLCNSHKASMSFIEKLGINYDGPVKTWKEDIESRKLQINQQPVHTNVPDSVDTGTQPCGESQHNVPTANTESDSTNAKSSEADVSSKNDLSSTSKVSQSTQCTEPSTTTVSNVSSSSVESIFKLEDIFGPTLETPKTYKIVMDNIDKNIKPNQMRMDNQTSMLFVTESTCQALKISHVFLTLEPFV